MAWCLLAGVLRAVPAQLERRRPAFRRVCAVSVAAVRFAGMPRCSRHSVGAAVNHALAWTAPVFAAETLALGGGGAARHGARLVLPAAVFGAETLGFRVGGAARHGARLSHSAAVFVAM